MHLREISYHSYFFCHFLYSRHRQGIDCITIRFYIFSIDVMSHVHQELTVANANQLANVKMEDLVIQCLENAIVQRGGR